MVTPSTTNPHSRANGRYSVLQHRPPKKPCDASYSSLRLNWSGSYESMPTSSLSAHATETPYSYYEDIDEIRPSLVTRLQVSKDSHSSAGTSGTPQLDTLDSMTYCNAYRFSDSSSQPDTCRLKAGEELCPLPPPQPPLRIAANAHTAVKPQPISSGRTKSSIGYFQGDSLTDKEVKREKK